MITQFGRNGVQKALHPVGAFLSRLGITPNSITIFGLVGVVATSLIFVTRGSLLIGLILVTLFCLTDMLDGAVARAMDRPSRWGAFLDSTADRVSDGAIFGALAYWLATEGRFSAMAAAMLAMLTGFLVSYVKARAEGLGLHCDGGFAGRVERLLIVGVGGILAIVGFSQGLDYALWILVALGFVTVGQRTLQVWRQVRNDD